MLYWESLQVFFPHWNVLLELKPWLLAASFGGCLGRRHDAALVAVTTWILQPLNFVLCALLAVAVYCSCSHQHLAHLKVLWQPPDECPHLWHWSHCTYSKDLQRDHCRGILVGPYVHKLQGYRFTAQLQLSDVLRAYSRLHGVLTDIIRKAVRC